MENLESNFKEINHDANEFICSENIEQKLEAFKDELEVRSQILKKLLDQINKDNEKRV